MKRNVQCHCGLIPALTVVLYVVLKISQRKGGKLEVFIAVLVDFLLCVNLKTFGTVFLWRDLLVRNRVNSLKTFIKSWVGITNHVPVADCTAKRRQYKVRLVSTIYD